MNVLIAILSNNPDNQGVQGWTMTAAAWQYWERMYKTLMENNSPFVVKENNDPVRYLWDAALKEGGSL